MKLSKYTHNFYESVSVRADLASRAILSIFGELFEVASIKDIGCGNGTWLRESLNHNLIKTRIGYDLPSAIASSNLFNNESINFRETDLELETSNFEFTELTLCLEVAEHLTSDSAEQVVEKICESTKYVIFSAATPGQGGFNHINEREFKYWISLFNSHGYAAFDIFREKIQSQKSIPTFYRNNVFLFIKSEEFNRLREVDFAKYSKLVPLLPNDNITDYRNRIQLIQSFIVSKLNFKVVNRMSQLKFVALLIASKFKL